MRPLKLNFFLIWEIDEGGSEKLTKPVYEETRMVCSLNNMF